MCVIDVDSVWKMFDVCVNLGVVIWRNMIFVLGGFFVYFLGSLGDDYVIKGIVILILCLIVYFVFIILF